MNSGRIDNIIKEEIKSHVNIINEESDSNLFKMFSKFLSDVKKRKNGKGKKKKMKLRKTKNGGKEYYDYDDYEKKNVKISTGDADSIRNTIDTENTNMAAVARTLFPDHTDEGAQSQFRKIVNGERPMTKKIASKIEKLISRGKIAVK